MSSRLDNKLTQRIGNFHANLSIGIIGMLIVIAGNFLPFGTNQKLCFLTGSLFLLVSSLLEKQLFFIIFQIIVATGTSIAFSAFPLEVKAAVPISLSILAIIYFIKIGAVKDDRAMIIGIAGIVILAAGYAVTNPIIYLTGSLFLMVYSIVSYNRGVKIALVWAVLNAVFAVSAIMNLLN